MSSIPTGIGNDILRPAVAGWEAWRDGFPVGPAPHTLRKSLELACEIKKDFVSQDQYRIKYTKGMQGRYFGRMNNADGVSYAKIFIQGITPHGPEPGQQNKWVIHDYVEIGPQWPSSNDDWTFELPKIPNIRSVPSSGSAGTADMLSATVTGLVQGFLDVPLPFPNSRFLTLVQTYGVAGLSGIILSGIQQAGILGLLNRNDYSYRELADAAVYKIDENRGYSKMGIYMRCQKSKLDVQHWKPLTRYAYVGKTETNFSDRYRNHPTGTHKYAFLNRACTELVSFALCILGVDYEKAMYHLAEQVLLCLMGTYRSNIVRLATRADHSPEDKGSRFAASVTNAAYFLGVASKVFMSTGYVPALSRQTFGVSEGANASSPMDEIEPFNQTNFLRLDLVMRDHDAAESVPIAEYRRERPLTANWIKNQSGGTKSEFTVLRIPAETGSRTKEVNAFAISAETNSMDGTMYPIQGTPCQIVIEVRLDGKPIKNSWARLPSIAPWTGWGQADSFALRVEWEYPEGSGTWRYRYIQTPRLYAQVDGQIPGSLLRFGIATAFISWLFQVKLIGFPTWIIRPSAFIRVRQVEINYMAQSVRIVPVKSKPLVTVVRRSASDISRQMAETGMDGKEEDCVSTSSYRVKCDLCYFLMRGGNTETDNKKCEKVEGNERLCDKCREWGLPACSWTSRLPSYRARIDKRARSLNADEVTIYDRAEATLFTMPEADTAGKTFKQNSLIMTGKDAVDEDFGED